MFTDAEESDDTEPDTFKDSLLKTIYFPKDSTNMLYLTDKLPKPSYGGELEVDLDNHKKSFNEQSSKLPGIQSKSPKYYEFGGKNSKMSKSPTKSKESEKENSPEKQLSSTNNQTIDTSKISARKPKVPSISPSNLLTLFQYISKSYKYSH